MSLMQASFFIPLLPLQHRPTLLLSSTHSLLPFWTISVPGCVALLPIARQRAVGLRIITARGRTGYSDMIQSDSEAAEARAIGPGPARHGVGMVVTKLETCFPGATFRARLCFHADRATGTQPGIQAFQLDNDATVDAIPAWSDSRRSGCPTRGSPLGSEFRTRK
jgi:hypothetical protein